jgi:glycerol-3-phosphate O-acyltransferase/dihydroxyacetone phosphate acyltransferase
MLYPLTRPLARITLSVFYRRIYWINANRLPRDRPVILASNHPTAFIEPCIFACWLDRPLHFIVRGNLFRKAWAARLLRDLHMIPVYRKKDGGMEEIKKNFSSLAEAEQVLLQNRTLHILAEGHTVHEKRLRPLRKGAARLGLRAIDHAPDCGLTIVPVGVNYTYANRFRSEVMIEFGKPIDVREFLPTFQEHPNKGISQLNDRLREELLQLLVVIDDPEREALTEQLLEMGRSAFPDGCWPITLTAPHRLRKEQEIAREVQQLDETVFGELSEKTAAYFKRLHSQGIRDRVVAQQVVSGIPPQWVRLLLWPLAWIGRGIHAIPLSIAYHFGYRKTRRLSYQSSLAVASGLGAYLLFLGALVGLGWSVAGLLAGLTVLALVLLLGVIALWQSFYQPYLQEKGRWQQLSPTEQNEIQNLRTVIVQLFDPLS